MYGLLPISSFSGLFVLSFLIAPFPSPSSFSLSPSSLPFLPAPLSPLPLFLFLFLSKKTINANDVLRVHDFSRAYDFQLVDFIIFYGESCARCDFFRFSITLIGWSRLRVKSYCGNLKRTNEQVSQFFRPRLPRAGLNTCTYSFFSAFEIAFWNESKRRKAGFYGS